MIGRDTIEAVLDRTDIVRLVQEYVPDLRKMGSDWVACCPFHQEKTPSFHVNAARQTWHCFGACQEGGNAIDFLMKREALTFPEAVKKLAGMTGMDIQELEESDEEREARLHREALLGLNGRVAAWYAGQLHAPENSEALAYARERFGQEYVDEEGLGFAPGSGCALVDWALSHGEREELLMELSLIGRNEQRGTRYDFFRNRLVFPIRDRAGRVTGFTCRDLSGSNECKYLNSKESAAYHKKESVYGIQTAWKEAMRLEQFYLVEGAPDAARMHSVGIYNVVAPLGGSWTREQLLQLKRAADCLCFINDADPPKEGENWGAGIEYVIRNGRTALELGFTVSVRELPLMEGNRKQDPGSFFTSADQLKVLPEEEFVGWCARKWWKDDDNVNRKAENVTRIASLASLVRDETRLEMLLDDLVKLRKRKDIWRSAINREKWRRIDEGKKERREVNLRTYGFVEDRGCYYGVTDTGDVQWSNFTLRPLYHIRDAEQPRRLFELQGAGRQGKVLLELDMEELNSLSKFRKKLEGMGNYIWMGGEMEMIKLKSYLYENTHTAQLVTQMGWNAAGFYAWGNGVWVDGDFRKADEYGIVHTGSDGEEGGSPTFWYIPSASRYSDRASYERQRKFVHRSLQRLRFGEYMQQFCEVYGDNGKVGLCYWLASLFRDVVTAATRSFPLLNLFGPKGSGKTEMAAALTAFFVTDNKAPNLRNSTNVALNDDVAYASNAIVHFDEYKNDIHANKIEFLKGLYDGVGRTKMGGSNFGERKMTSVRCGVVFSGQEIPTADIALFHRCVFLTFPRSEFSQQEKERFNRLRQVQELGLTDLTLVALGHRKRVQGAFPSAYAEVCERIYEHTRTLHIETRILENWAKILAVFRCVEGRLQFPFGFDDIFQLSLQLLRKQNSMSGEGNELAHFWRTIMYLRDNGDLFERADYILKDFQQFSSDIVSGRQFSSPRRILLLNLSRVFTLYKESARRTGDKIIPDDALREYIKNCDYYLGIVRAVRFISMQKGYEQKEATPTGRLRTVTRVTRAMAFDYEMLKEQYGISLDTETDGSDAGGTAPSDDDGRHWINRENYAAD